jgi:hypothetical protein
MGKQKVAITDANKLRQTRYNLSVFMSSSLGNTDLLNE